MNNENENEVKCGAWQIDNLKKKKGKVYRNWLKQQRKKVKERA